jgi:hypothetical protein
VNGINDTTVCSSHLGEFLGAIRAVPEILDDLLVTMARLDVGAPSVGAGGSNEPPLIYRPEASDCARDLHAVLSTWARALVWTSPWLTGSRPGSPAQVAAVPAGTSRTRPVPAAVPVGQATLELARWLDRHARDVADNEHGGTIVDEVCDAVARARHATDRPAARIYLGPCECGEQLYAAPAAVAFTCKACDTRHYVSDRRRWMLTQSRRVLLTGEQLARAIPALLGVEVTAQLLRDLSRRQGLESHPPAKWDAHQRRRYRVGDVVDLLMERANRAQKRLVRRRRPAPPPDEALPPDVAGLFRAVREAAAVQ